MPLWNHNIPKGPKPLKWRTAHKNGTLCQLHSIQFAQVISTVYSITKKSCKLTCTLRQKKKSIQNQSLYNSDTDNLTLPKFSLLHPQCKKDLNRTTDTLNREKKGKKKDAAFAKMANRNPFLRMLRQKPKASDAPKINAIHAFML